MDKSSKSSVLKHSKFIKEEQIVEIIMIELSRLNVCRSKEKFSVFQTGSKKQRFGFDDQTFWGKKQSSAKSREREAGNLDDRNSGNNGDMVTEDEINMFKCGKDLAGRGDSL